MSQGWLPWPDDVVVVVVVGRVVVVVGCVVVVVVVVVGRVVVVVGCVVVVVVVVVVVAGCVVVVVVPDVELLVVGGNVSPMTEPLHKAPLRENCAGTGLDPLQLPLNPNWVEAPVPRVPLYEALLAVTTD